eukprot:TRINITY_DN14541_c0_g1_i1.p1 TRINITY_DN14541_c0_g1~~TRINITY_DN14541_c0_g1_i1.p1  ORF type:complete len:1070 (+),score=174.52 TRINITY_DN14541_c0_g1_i1:355-3210(+)
MTSAGFCVGSFGTVIALCMWSLNGLLPQEHIGHVHMTKTRVGHIHSPIFSTPAMISLHGTSTAVFDVRIIGMALHDFANHGDGGHGASGHAGGHGAAGHVEGIDHSMGDGHSSEHGAASGHDSTTEGHGSSHNEGAGHGSNATGHGSNATGHGESSQHGDAGHDSTASGHGSGHDAHAGHDAETPAHGADHHGSGGEHSGHDESHGADHTSTGHDTEGSEHTSPDHGAGGAHDESDHSAGGSEHAGADHGAAGGHDSDHAAGGSGHESSHGSQGAHDSAGHAPSGHDTGSSGHGASGSNAQGGVWSADGGVSHDTGGMDHGAGGMGHDSSDHTAPASSHGSSHESSHAGDAASGHAAPEDHSSGHTASGGHSATGSHGGVWSADGNGRRLSGFSTRVASESGWRRYFGNRKRWTPRRLAEVVEVEEGAPGTLTYRLLADGKEFFKKTIALEEDEEVEHFETVQAAELVGGEAEHYSVEVTGKKADGHDVAFMCQVLRMNANANYRFHIGAALFVITFVSIVAEFIHRSYSAALGSSAVLCTLAAIQETPELHQVTAMIEFGTLMLLFSMMILMQMLAMTGFFNWFALKVIILSKQDPVRLFFLLTNACGFMSMVLDNVTCVLLTGPLTYQIAKKMQLAPRPLYLSMTICATIGGTATLIGDPPNIVIGMKLKLGFETFLFVNFPIIAFVQLPLASAFLYWRFKDTLRRYDGGSPPKLDIAQLTRENQIKDEPMFAELGCVLGAILVALLLSPIHHIEPAWFTVMAMFACALRFDRHHMGKWLELVEWDTLFFFALLFVLVEALSELGVIRTLGHGIMQLIEFFPESYRMYMAIIIILWVSGIGSAFLESLPYTATMVYIIQDLMGQDVPGVDVPRLVWPLSIGACVGGIGSIMGSSANLVCMAISGRNCEDEKDKVQGKDFLAYGFPVLCVLMLVSTFWLILLLIWCDFSP